MNDVQNNYIVATVILKTVEEEEREFEKNYCSIKGYNVNKIYALDDIEEFDKANDELAALEQQNGLWDRVCDAREKQKAAEEHLINYALSIIPFNNLKNTLRHGANTNWKIRQNIINLVMRLDIASISV